MQQRSTFVTVTGWVFLLLAGFGLLNCLALLFMPLDQLTAEVPQQAGGVKIDPDLLSHVMRGVFFVMFGVLAWAVLSAIGLIMRKPWARISMIVLLGLGIVWNLLYVLMGVTGGPAGMGAMMQGMGVALAVIGTLLIVVFASVIYKLTRQKIKQEFAAPPSSK